MEHFCGSLAREAQSKSKACVSREVVKDAIKQSGSDDSMNLGTILYT